MVTGSKDLPKLCNPPKIMDIMGAKGFEGVLAKEKGGAGVGSLIKFGSNEVGSRSDILIPYGS